MHPTLKLYISTLKELYLSDYWHVSNANLEYITASPSFIEFLKSHNAWYKNFIDFTSQLNKISNHPPTKLTKFINSGQRTVKCLLLLQAHSNIRLYELKLFKIINHTNGELLGLIYFYNNISQHNSIINNELYNNKVIYNNNVPTMIQVLEEAITYSPANIYLRFNQREQIIIWLLATGNSHKEIAFILSKIEKHNISNNTVTTIINRNIYKKLNINNNHELLVKLNQENGLSSIPKPLYDYFARNK